MAAEKEIKSGACCCCTQVMAAHLDIIYSLEAESESQEVTDAQM